MGIQPRSLSDYLRAKQVVNDGREEIGPMIKSARQAIGKTQTAFAAQIGMPQAYLSMIENKVRTPSVDALTRIVSALDQEGALDGTDFVEPQAQDQ